MQWPRTAIAAFDLSFEIKYRIGNEFEDRVRYKIANGNENELENKN